MQAKIILILAIAALPGAAGSSAPPKPDKDPRFLLPIQTAENTIKETPASKDKKRARAWKKVLESSASRSTAQDTTTVITGFQGQVTLIRGTQQLSPETTPLLREADRLELGAKSLVEIRIPDGSSIVAHADTKLQFRALPRRPGGRAAFSLDQGRVTVHAPQKGAPIRALTPRTVGVVRQGRAVIWREKDGRLGGQARYGTLELRGRGADEGGAPWRPLYQ